MDRLLLVNYTGKKNMFSRWQKENLKSLAKKRRVLVLCGPRQCGKTTLSLTLEEENTLYRTLDDTALLAAAKNDPKSFIQHDQDMMIIDEVQRVPQLLLAVKEAVDKSPRPGQYLLTGSANPYASPMVQESLAGRVSLIRLRGLSQGELENKPPSFLEKVFDHRFSSTYQCSQQDVIRRAFRGGFPEAIQLDEIDRPRWHNDYFDALIARDLRDISNIRRKETLRLLINILAAWSGNFIDFNHIMSSLSLQRQTIESYINALESLYIVEKLPPWIKTDYERVGKKSKIYMTDCGSLTALLNWNKDKIYLDTDSLGKLVETFVFNELMAFIDCSKKRYHLSQYRDKDRREIDFILEDEEGNIAAIEVKAGSNISKNHFRHMEWFQSKHAQKNHFRGILLYTGENVLSFGENLWAVPISALWS